MTSWWQSAYIGTVREDEQRQAIAASSVALKSADQQNASFWSRSEASAYGFMAELVFARHMGLTVTPQGERSERRPDVGKYEIRSSPWRTAEHWHLCDGGRTFVYPRELTPGLVVVRLDLFLKGMKVWALGWLPAVEARKFPLDKGKGTTRHAVPTWALRNPRELIRIDTY